MSDDEDQDDPFADFEKPDDGSDPFTDLGAEDATSANDGDEPEGEADPAAPFEETTEPGRLPDDPFTNRDADRPDRPKLAAEEDGTVDAGNTATASDAPADQSAESEPATPDDPVAETGDEADPFADLGGGPQPRTRGDSEGDDPFETFESVDVGGVDADEVWSSLSSVDDTAAEFDERVYYEVSKHRFCEQCPNFSGPPEARCAVDGTEIVEFVDMETVRLVNCPVVAEQEDLGEDVTRYEPE